MYRVKRGVGDGMVWLVSLGNEKKKFLYRKKKKKEKKDCNNIGYGFYEWKKIVIKFVWIYNFGMYNEYISNQFPSSLNIL